MVGRSFFAKIGMSLGIAVVIMCAAVVGLGLAPGTCGTSLVVTAAGGVVALNGIDNVQAGLRQVWTGKPTQTMTSSSVEYATGSHLAGEVVDTAIGLISPAGVLKFANIFKKTCFTAGTQIVVGANYNNEGSGVEYVTVNIEDIKVGDLVYSYDTITGEVSQKAVTDTFVRTSNHINYLTIIDETGNEQILETTDSHPFWVVTDNPDLSRVAQEIVDEDGTILYHENIGVTEYGYWVEAKDLREGDVFLGANGELSILVFTERVEFPDGITVYNFTVDGNHDYFVIAQEYELGQTCILVHNADYDLVGHHTIPKQIQKMLSPDVAANPKIRGVKGTPNIKYIPEWLHKAIHTGGRGGAYNARFIKELEKLGDPKKITPEKVLEIRDMLVKEFGL
jgi:intein/homing endonuclease